MRPCKIVTQIGGADRGGRLPPKSDLIEIRQLGPGMRKTSPYGVQREAAIVLLAAKPFLGSCEQDLAIPGDGRSRIMGSVVNSKCEHFLDPQLLKLRSTLSAQSLPSQLEITRRGTDSAGAH